MEETVDLLGGKISVGNHPHDERRDHRSYSGSRISSPPKACLDLKGPEEGPHGNIPHAPYEKLKEHHRAAVAKLSVPVLKSFDTETLIKVKLDF